MSGSGKSPDSTAGPEGQGRSPSTRHDQHHAKQRRKRREVSRAKRSNRREIAREESQRLYIYGLHTVRQAVLNPARRKLGLYATGNALQRLELDTAAFEGVPVHDSLPRDLDRMVGSDAVHQGCVLEVEPLEPRRLDALGDCDLVLVLDQVTDPHNVGAIMRSAVAMGAGALITTSRHSPVETGVLAKSASGALDLIDHLEVRNLAEAIETLNAQGFQTIGLDSEGPQRLEHTVKPGAVALVLGSEGKGLRQKTRETCTALARIDMPGEIKSLNVSNAAILALYVIRTTQGG